MERDRRLDEEFMREGAPLFEWEVNSVQKRREWEARQLARAQSGEASRQSPEQETPAQGLVQSLVERFKGLPWNKAT